MADNDIPLDPDLNLDQFINGWQYDPDNLNVRMAIGDDGRDVIQMRVEMGVLQLEVSDRPDGERPYGYGSVLEHLTVRRHDEHADWTLDESNCHEVDREFVQFYHRRICWLKLHEFDRAIRDADHTLELMDLCRETSPDPQWTLSHEQYRPFVLFHRTQAEAFAALEDDLPEEAVNRLNLGLERMRESFEYLDATDHFEEDELVIRMTEMRESLRQEYHVGRTLAERLTEAVASEQYEMAAKLRDEIARRSRS